MTSVADKKEFIMKKLFTIVLCAILETDLFYHNRNIPTEINHALEYISQY